MKKTIFGFMFVMLLSSVAVSCGETKPATDAADSTDTVAVDSAADSTATDSAATDTAVLDSVA